MWMWMWDWLNLLFKNRIIAFNFIVGLPLLFFNDIINGNISNYRKHSNAQNNHNFISIKVNQSGI